MQGAARCCCPIFLETDRSRRGFRTAADGRSVPALSRLRQRREPGVEIGQRAPRQRRLALGLLDLPVERREQAEIDVHRLEGRGLGAAGDVARAARRARSWPAAAPALRPLPRRRRSGPPEGRSRRSRRSPRRPVIWPAKRMCGSALQAQLAIEQARAVDEGVAVQAAQARELGAAPGPGSCGRCASARRR